MYRQMQSRQPVRIVIWLAKQAFRATMPYPARILHAKMPCLPERSEGSAVASGKLKAAILPNRPPTHPQCRIPHSLSTPEPCHPVDKPKGVVKSIERRGPALSRSVEPGVWRPSLTRVLCESFLVEFVDSTSHRCGRDFDHDSFCEHPACAGCEGAHSNARSSLRRPQE